MPVIKIAPKVKREKRKMFIQLPADLVRDLEEYARYLGGDTDIRYIVEKVLEKFVRSDKKFEEWRQKKASDGG